MPRALLGNSSFFKVAVGLSHTGRRSQGRRNPKGCGSRKTNAMGTLIAKSPLNNKIGCWD
jgi:hypothetical protein